MPQAVKPACRHWPAKQKAGGAAGLGSKLCTTGQPHPVIRRLVQPVIFDNHCCQPLGAQNILKRGKAAYEVKGIYLEFANPAAVADVFETHVIPHAVASEAWREDSDDDDDDDDDGEAELARMAAALAFRATMNSRLRV